MRFPSLRSLASEASATARRFPLPLLCAAAATACALWSIDAGRAQVVAIRGLQTALLGIPLLLAIALVQERAGDDARARGWGLVVLAAALAGLVGYCLATAGWTWVGGWTRFLHLALACHLLVAFLPFVGPAQLGSFWAFNRTLFLRFLLSTVFATVLFGGAALAVLGVDRLLGLDTDAEVFLRLFVLAVGLFHPWHFLAGVPRLAGAPAAPAELPVALRVFAQFLLLPLVGVYLLILNVYVVRLLVLQTWPVRTLGLLVGAVAVAGWLALLLLYPLRVRPEYRWLDLVERAFHAAALPPAIVLLVALALRVGGHGLTERRYLLAMLALWLIGLSLFQLATLSRNVKLVPTSLALLALFTFGGPWSAYAASRQEQRARLLSLLEEARMLDAERATPPPEALSFDLRRRLSVTVTYLLEAHGTGAIEPWLDARADAPNDPGFELRRGADAGPIARRVLEDLDVGYVDRWMQETAEAMQRFDRFSSMDKNPLDVSSFDWALRFSIPRGQAASFQQEGESWTLEHVAPDPVLRLRAGEEILASIDLAPFLERLLEESASPGRLDPSTTREHLSVEFASARVRGLVVFDQLYGAKQDGTLRIDQIAGEMYYSVVP